MRKTARPSRKCVICETEFIPKRVDSYCCSKECWLKKDRIKHHKSIRKRDMEYKDRVRHGGKRAELLNGKTAYRCSICGVTGSGFDIVAHHVSGNSQDHEHQIQLCRKCHAKIHDLGHKRKKEVSKEQIQDALARFKRLEDSCKYLGITRSFLRKKRIEYGLPKRKVANGLGGRKRRSKLE